MRVHWVAVPKALRARRVNRDDGTHESLSRRERPQVLLIGGQPSVLLNGAEDQRGAAHSFTLAQRIATSSSSSSSSSAAAATRVARVAPSSLSSSLSARVADPHRQRPPPTCNLMPGRDLFCHNSTRGGVGPRGHYAVWCDDLVQIPCKGPPACDSCSALHGCHALCVKNASAGGPCRAWSYNHQHQLCFLKGLPDFPANSTYQHKAGRPQPSADTSGYLWNQTLS
jgi:hypothetical protein